MGTEHHFPLLLKFDLLSNRPENSKMCQNKQMTMRWERKKCIHLLDVCAVTIGPWNSYGKNNVAICSNIIFFSGCVVLEAEE
jgi:hypothetical protein